MKTRFVSPVLAALAALAGSAPALAQNSALTVRVDLAQASYAALRETPLMVSVLKDGAIVQQEEIHPNSSARFNLAPGTYDLRVEGDGAITVSKRGVIVTAGNTTNVLGGPMRAGKGLRVVEYSTGGLAREEVAARLARLEAAVDSIKKAAAAEARPRQ